MTKLLLAALLLFSSSALAEQVTVGNPNPLNQHYVQETQANGQVLIIRVVETRREPVQADDNGLAWWKAQGNTLEPAKPYVAPVEAKPEMTEAQVAEVAQQDPAVDAAAKAALECLILVRVVVGEEDPCALQREAYIAAKGDAVVKTRASATIIEAKPVGEVEP